MSYTYSNGFTPQNISYTPSDLFPPRTFLHRAGVADANKPHFNQHDFNPKTSWDSIPGFTAPAAMTKAGQPKPNGPSFTYEIETDDDTPHLYPTSRSDSCRVIDVCHLPSSLMLYFDQKKPINYFAGNTKLDRQYVVKSLHYMAIATDGDRRTYDQILNDLNRAFDQYSLPCTKALQGVVARAPNDILSLMNAQRFRGLEQPQFSMSPRSNNLNAGPSMLSPTTASQRSPSLFSGSFRLDLGSETRAYSQTSTYSNSGNTRGGNDTGFYPERYGRSEFSRQPDLGPDRRSVYDMSSHYPQSNSAYDQPRASSSREPYSSPSDDNPFGLPPPRSSSSRYDNYSYDQEGERDQYNPYDR